MIITCIVQVSGLTVTGSGNFFGELGESFDGVWQVFWSQVEACVAVTVISFTSFRSLFVASNPGGSRRKIYKWYSSRRSKEGGSKGSKESPETSGQRSQEKSQQSRKSDKTLPPIPLDTLRSTDSSYRGLRSVDSGYGGLKSVDDSGYGPVRQSASTAARARSSDSEFSFSNGGMATIALKPPSDEDVSPLSTDERPLPSRPSSDGSSMHAEPESPDWQQHRLFDEEMLIGYPLANRAQPTQPYYNLSFDTDSTG